MSKRRVVISGLGCVTSLGESASEMFDAVCEGKSGISLIEAFDPSDYTYDPITGKLVFSYAIPSDATVTVSYWYDRYIIEDVNSYGNSYIELICNKISRT